VANFSVPQIIWHIFYSKPVPSCISCGGNVKFKSFQNGYNDTCCNKCAQHNPATIAKIQTTNINRYGKPYGLQATEIKRKSVNSCVHRYGVQNISQYEPVKQQKRQTCNTNFGVDYYLSKHDAVSEAFFKKHKVYNASFVEEFLDKRRATKRSDFYDRLYNSNRLQGNCIPLFTKDEYVKNGYYFNYKFKCVTCNSEFVDCLEDGDIPRCPTCFTSKSQFETEVGLFVQSIYNQQIVFNDRAVLGGKELDILLPMANIAIECNGLFWHSEHNGKSKYYHARKSEDCLSAGIRLIHIFEDEWMLQKNIVQSFLSSLLISQPVIMARKTVAKEISSREAITFLNNHHFQGADNSSIKVGLFVDDKLLSVLTVGKDRFSRSKSSEIYRFCSIVGVTGGLSKMLKFIHRNHSISSFVTYCDLSKFDGQVYLKNGFSLIKKCEPSYQYFSRKRYFRQHRFNFRKSQLHKKLEHFDPLLSGHANITNHDYFRIWDCGNLKFERTFND